MDLSPLIPLGFLAVGAAAIFGLDRLVRWMFQRGWLQAPSEESTRRGTGHAMLGLQQFVDPSAEQIIAVENLEQKEQDDLAGEGTGEDAIRTDLAASLAESTIDPEEVRRHLASAVRAGLDWREVYDMAVRAELTARPYRAPSLPPASRVVPRVG
jgi:hypothetical protein